MGYVLENSGEGRRLEKQSRQKHYSVDQELLGVTFSENEKVLDAGCGTGIVSKFLCENYPNHNLEIFGVDQSLDRVEIAKNSQLGIHNNQIHYAKQNLFDLEFADNTFDKIICRYVIEHVDNRQGLIKSLKRVLKPGGQLIIIDFDGLFLNIGTLNQKLQSDLESLNTKLGVDLFIGRKLPQMFNLEQFKDIEWKTTFHDFKGKDRNEEIENNRSRCELIRPSLNRVFTNKSSIDDFINAYLEEIQNPLTPLFHTKFITKGTK
ncbi:MAG: class I SAM-dependent methyltransferase [Bacteriovoracaceae bacterium]